MNNNVKQNNKKRKIITVVIAVIVSFALILSAIFLYTNFFKKNINPVSIITNNDPGYNFSELEKLYPDIIAWIKVPGTPIDTPIVQNKKNDFYYLSHNAQQEYDPAGAAYIELKNHSDFQDPVTVVYGHNMLDDRIFSKQLCFADRAFFNENKEFYIYLPGHKYTYTIVSAYVNDDRHILNSYDFSNSEVVKKYFDEVTHPKSLSQNVREDIKLTPDSKIVQLSTCMNDLSLTNQRYILTGVLTNDVITD